VNSRESHSEVVQTSESLLNVFLTAEIALSFKRVGQPTNSV